MPGFSEGSELNELATHVFDEGTAVARGRLTTEVVDLWRPALVPCAS